MGLGVRVAHALHPAQILGGFVAKRQQGAEKLISLKFFGGHTYVPLERHCTASTESPCNRGARNPEKQTHDNSHKPPTRLLPRGCRKIIDEYVTK